MEFIGLGKRTRGKELAEKIEDGHVQNKVTKEPVGDGSLLGQALPAVVGVLEVALGELHAQRHGEHEDADAGEEARQEGVERERTHGHGVDQLDDARGKDVAKEGVDDLQGGGNVETVGVEDVVDDRATARLGLRVQGGRGRHGCRLLWRGRRFCAFPRASGCLRKVRAVGDDRGTIGTTSNTRQRVESIDAQSKTPSVSARLSSPEWMKVANENTEYNAPELGL